MRRRAGPSGKETLPTRCHLDVAILPPEEAPARSLGLLAWSPAFCCCHSLRHVSALFCGDLLLPTEILRTQEAMIAEQRIVPCLHIPNGARQAWEPSRSCPPGMNQSTPLLPSLPFPPAVIQEMAKKHKSASRHTAGNGTAEVTDHVA